MGSCPLCVGHGTFNFFRVLGVKEPEKNSECGLQQSKKWFLNREVYNPCSICALNLNKVLDFSATIR